jgi:hypothetical protein
MFCVVWANMAEFGLHVGQHDIQFEVFGTVHLLLGYE